MKGLFLAWAGVLTVLTATTSAHGQGMQFPTGPPQLVEPADPAAGVGQSLWTKDAYDRLSEARKGDASFVPLRALPANLSRNARFGGNLVFGSKNHGFVVDGDATQGFQLFADVNGDGDLRGVAPARFERHDNYFTAAFRVADGEVPASEGTGATIPARLIVVPEDGELKHSLLLSTTRAGLAALGSRQVAFRLVGRGGAYSSPTNSLWIDINGDGKGFDPEDPNEFYRVRERHVNIDGRSYEFAVDPQGRYLSLTALREPVPERASLQPGTVPPAFSARDMTGRPLSLADNRGKVVLLDFWAIWCGPCREESPVLRAIYERHRAEGFEIIGVSPDAQKDVEKYVSTERQSWPQILDGENGQLNRLFRVVGLPTHVLTGRDGRIVWVREGGIGDQVSAFAEEVKRELAKKE